jgi:hypothetical protein
MDLVVSGGAIVDMGLRELEDDRVASIYTTQIDRVVALGCLLTGNPAEAEDLAQEVFTGVIRRSRKEPGFLHEPTWPWLRLAVVRLAMRRRRQLAAELRRMMRTYQPTSEGYPRRSGRVDAFAAAQATVLVVRTPFRTSHWHQTQRVPSRLGVLVSQCRTLLGATTARSPTRMKRYFVASTASSVAIGANGLAIVELPCTERRGQLPSYPTVALSLNMYRTLST